MFAQRKHYAIYRMASKGTSGTERLVRSLARTSTYGEEKQKVALVRSADQRDLFHHHLPILKAKENKSDKGTFA